MRKTIRSLFVVLCFAVALTASVTQAQQCPSPYAQIQSNERYVKTALMDATKILARMKSLAYLGSLPQPLVNLDLFTQRAAINNEFEALKAEIDFLGNPSVGFLRPTFLRPTTVQFLNAVLNTQNMGIAGTSLLGATQAEAEANSTVAETASTEALGNLWRCY